MSIRKVGVLGCGLMGSGIAEVAAKAGADVVLRSRKQETADAMLVGLDRSLTRQVDRGKLEETEAHAKEAESRAAKAERLAELDPDLLERVRRMRLLQGHRHVQVRDAGLEARVEDRHVEERVDGVQNGVGSRLSDQRDDRALARRVDRVRREARVIEVCYELRGPRRVVVGERAVIEERSTLRDSGEGGADATRSDDENPHGARVLHHRTGL